MNPALIDPPPNTDNEGVMRRGVRLPQPIPYQGSKRLLAPRILSFVNNRKFRRLYEPFAGSAAITLAAARLRLADEFVIGDSLSPLIGIWLRLLNSPEDLARDYEQLWCEQIDDPASHYEKMRHEFNLSADSVKLLYLLARCVKNAPRFNRMGGFNQSPDHRRRGMRPAKMREEVFGAWALLRDRTTAVCADYESLLADATPEDLVYLDPPYHGVSNGRDRRYHRGLERDRLTSSLERLKQRGVPYLLSYDGSCGDKVYSTALPGSIGATQIVLNAGRSSQATLLGRNDVTIESLYVWDGFLNTSRSQGRSVQLRLLEHSGAYELNCAAE